jgi:hypothetical protein
MAVDASGSERLREYEPSFARAGLPPFIEDIDPAEDIFNRAAPLLGLVFTGEVFGAINLDWNWWQNALAVAAGLAVLFVAVGLVNRARNRPFSAIPERLTDEMRGSFLDRTEYLRLRTRIGQEP